MTRKDNITVLLIATILAVFLSTIRVAQADYTEASRIGPWVTTPALTVAQPRGRASFRDCDVMGAAWGGNIYRGYPFAVLEEQHDGDPCGIGMYKYIYPSSGLLNLLASVLVVAGAFKIGRVTRRKII